MLSYVGRAWQWHPGERCAPNHDPDVTLLQGGPASLVVCVPVHKKIITQDDKELAW